MDEAVANALVRELRIDRGVLWARVEWPATAAKKGIEAKSTAPGRRLLMRVRDGVTPDWGALLARLSARAGVPVKAERQIGNVWVLSVAENQAPEALERIAALIQQDADVQYADAVKRVRPHAAPNDPYFSRQWSLIGSVAGINAEAAWALQPDAAGVTVAVIDTGILPHPDLVGRRAARLRLHLRPRPRP